MVRADFDLLKEKLTRKKTEAEMHGDDHKRYADMRSKWQQRKEKSLEARAVIQTVAQQTQRNVEKRISNLITLALQAVIDDKQYSFEAEFVQRRNKTECDLWLVENGVRLRPMGSTGGGAIDIMAFAGRPAFATFRPCRRIIISDEPFRNLSSKYHAAASRMLKMICDTKDSTGRSIVEQMIIVSHVELLNSEADHVVDMNAVKTKKRGSRGKK